MGISEVKAETIPPNDSYHGVSSVVAQPLYIYTWSAPYASGVAVVEKDSNSSHCLAC